MEGYLGETPTTFKKHFRSRNELALYYIGSYGQIDGSHHKQWVLDQVARILKGCEIILTIAKWDNGHEELRVTTGKESPAYIYWVKEMKGKYIKDDDYEGYEYGYDEGIAP